MDLGPLIQPADTTILVVLMDGLGGYPDVGRGTELEDAGVGVADWRTARREGRADARAAVRELCRSGAEDDAEATS